MTNIYIFQVINTVLLLTLLGCSVYGFALFVKLARRGIKALDIYLSKHKNT